MSEHGRRILEHYERIWQRGGVPKRWSSGPVSKLPHDFHIIEFPPSPNREMWTYATCCMSQWQDVHGIELHLFSPVQSMTLVELLTVIAHFHRTAALLGLGHTVNFGRPWLDESLCNYGLLSRPYLDGPILELFEYDSQRISFLWCIPITLAEREYKKQNGLEALEDAFERNNFNYLDPKRPSVV